MTTIHHSPKGTADEVNAGLCLLSDAENLQRGSGGTFEMRFSKKASCPQFRWLGESPSSSGCSALPFALTREDVWSRQEDDDDDDEGYEINAVPISSAYSCHLRAVSL